MIPFYQDGDWSPPCGSLPVTNSREILLAEFIWVEVTARHRQPAPRLILPIYISKSNTKTPSQIISSVPMLIMRRSNFEAGMLPKENGTAIQQPLPIPR